MPGRGKRGFGWCHGQLRGCGYRLTLPRQAIIDVLSARSGHLCAEEIHRLVGGEYPGIGLATVYRTLELLAEMGLVTRLDFGDGRSRYELSAGSRGGPRHHHHLVCTGCGRVVDYDDFIDEEVKLLKETEKGLARKYNFNIKDHLIQFYGLCRSCDLKKEGR